MTTAFITHISRAAAESGGVLADLRFPIWIRLLPAVGGLLVLGLAAIFWMRGRRSLGARLGLLGVFVVFLITPSMWGDRIVVSDMQIEQPKRLVGPRARGFRFADVDSVRIAIQRDDRGDRQEVWYTHAQDGRVDSFVAGDLWRFHRDSILTLLRANNVDIRPSSVVAAR